MSLARVVQPVVGVAVLVCAFALGMWLASGHSGDDGASIDGLLWPDPPAVADVHLRDHHGRPFGLEQLQGRWTLLFFGFTHCPDVCPTTLATLASAQAQLRQLPSYGARGQTVFVSIDPERDEEALIGDYVNYFAPDFLGVTGSEPELTRFARSLGALFMKVRQGHDDYTMDHSAGIFFISPDAHLLSVLTPPHTATGIVQRFMTISRFIEDKP